MRVGSDHAGFELEARAHNDTNLPARSGKSLITQQAEETVHIFLETAFKGGRNERRISKTSALE
jgi:ribose 5-phosphate isomerase RpiB